MAVAPSMPESFSFNRMTGGIGQTVADIGRGIGDLGLGIAAGFARDPGVRESATFAIAERQRERAAQLDRVADGFRTLFEVAQAMPGRPLPASLREMAKRQGQLFVRLGGSPEEAQFALGLIEGAANMPALQSDLQRKVADAEAALGRRLTESEKAQIFGIADETKAQSAIAKINADLQAGLITPEQAAAAIRRETFITPTAPREPVSRNIITMRFPDGREQSFDSRDQAGLTAALQAGAVERAPLTLADQLNMLSGTGAGFDPTTGGFGGGTPGAAPAPSPAPVPAPAPTGGVGGTGRNIGGGTVQPSLFGPGSTPDNPVAVQTPEEAAALPVGTYFKTPSGQVKRR